MKKRLQQGFTLIELLVVVAIIAILALVVMLALNPVEMQRRSRDSRRLSDIGTVRRALDLALVDGATLQTHQW
jgi:prepilin-type N-terminal cleavage/methylation domain-containing protein